MRGYCPQHQAVYDGVKPRFNVALFIFLIICTWALWIVYLIYYAVQNDDRCPICGTRLIAESLSSQGGAATYQPFETMQYTAPPNEEYHGLKYCPICGSKLDPGASFCGNCGQKL